MSVWRREVWGGECVWRRGGRCGEGVSVEERREVWGGECVEERREVWGG